MAASLLVPKSFGPRDAPEWFLAWGRASGDPALTLALQSGAFLGPAGIVLLAAGIAHRTRSGLATSLTREASSDDAFRYLQRIDFFDCLGVEPPEACERREERARFVPLQRIIDLKTARELADRTAEVLELQAPTTSPSILRLARYVFEELGANVVQHSGAPETGFGLAQLFPSSRRIQIAFADAGVGFLASLQRNFEWQGRVESPVEALQLCLSLRVSGAELGRKNMGFGLFQLQTFADQLGGDLWIASGDALLHRRTTIGRERANVISTIPAWTGSWICLDAPVG